VILVEEAEGGSRPYLGCAENRSLPSRLLSDSVASGKKESGSWSRRGTDKEGKGDDATAEVSKNQKQFPAVNTPLVRVSSTWGGEGTARMSPFPHHR